MNYTEVKGLSGFYEDDDGHMVPEDVIFSEDELNHRNIAKLESEAAASFLDHIDYDHKKLKDKYEATKTKEDLFKLADFYFSGWTYDYMDFNILNKAAKLGHINSAIRLAEQYYYDGVTPNERLSKSLYYAKIALNQGSKEILELLGDIYNERKEYDKAFNFYETASFNKNSLALLKLAIAKIRYTRKIFPSKIKDKHKNDAFKILTSLCKNSTEYFEALLYLGVCYFEGIGTNVDYDKAFKCFQDAAEKNLQTWGINNSNMTYWIGKEYAYFNCAYCLENGFGTEKNEQKAFEIYNKYSSLFPEAEYRKAECYEKGIGIKKDSNKALECYKEMAGKEYHSDEALIYYCHKGEAKIIDTNEIPF